MSQFKIWQKIITAYSKTLFTFQYESIQDEDDAEISHSDDDHLHFNMSQFKIKMPGEHENLLS